MSVLDNVALTTKIKAALIFDERIDSSGIDVDTVGQGEVHLKGRTPSDVQAKLAEDLAKLNGAHTVVNELTWDRVVEVNAEDSPAAAGAYGGVTTSAGAPSTGLQPLPMRVMDALDADPRVNAYLLTVEPRESGMIALTGRQGTVQERDAALEVARAVEGVGLVVDEIGIQPAY